MEDVVKEWELDELVAPESDVVEPDMVLEVEAETDDEFVTEKAVDVVDPITDAAVA